MFCSGLRELLIIPSNIQRAFSQGNKLAGSLVYAAASQQVCSRQSLAAAWQTSGSFLQPELTGCLPKASSTRLQELWSTLRQQAMAAQPGMAPG